MTEMTACACAETWRMMYKHMLKPHGASCSITSQNNNEKLDLTQGLCMQTQPLHKLYMYV